MSSATSDSTDKTLLHAITGYISQIQRKCIFTQQRFHSIRRHFFQSIGLSIVLYFVVQLPFLLYSLLQLLVRVIFFVLTIVFWPPLQALQFVLPKSSSYGMLIPLFSLLSVVSFFLAKLFAGKRSKPSKNYSFAYAFLVILLFQAVFILRPIALSIHEQRNSSPTPPARRIESNSIAAEQMSSRPAVESDVKDKHSKLIDRDKLVAASVPPEKVSAERHVNGLGEPNQEFRSQARKQIRQPLPSLSNLPAAAYEQLILRQKLLNRLDEAWDIWHQGKFVHCSSTSQMQHLPRHHVSSIYTAYTDGDCDEHTKFIDHQQSAKSTHLDVLDFYRRRAPFPVYLSVLKSNGPKCYGRYPDSFCSNPSKRASAHLTKFLYSFGQFWMLISIPLLVFVLLLRYYQRCDKNRSLRNHQIVSNPTTDLPLQQASVPVTENDTLMEELENDLRVWLERERRDGYRNMSETYRRALNDRCLKKHVSNYTRVFHKRRPRCSHGKLLGVKDDLFTR